MVTADGAAEKQTSYEEDHQDKMQAKSPLLSGYCLMFCIYLRLISRDTSKNSQKPTLRPAEKTNLLGVRKGSCGGRLCRWDFQLVDRSVR